jgi:hypothetical protein
MPADPHAKSIKLAGDAYEEAACASYHRLETNDQQRAAGARAAVVVFLRDLSPVNTHVASWIITMIKELEVKT